MLRVEFHCHTVYSKDSLTQPSELLAACRRKGIDRVAVTDHNCLQGARRARELDPQRVILGEEIMTTRGELLAFFVEEVIPPGLSPEETIRLLRQQKAFISVSHPFDRWRSGHWQPRHLLEILPLVDAIETFNARCMWPGFNRQAQSFARQHSLAGTVGSDAHTTIEVGRATLLLPDFQDAASLKEALPQAKARLSLSAPYIHLTSRYAVWVKKLAKRQKGDACGPQP